MKFLIITQKVDKNDPILGFFHRWILEFAKHCEQTTVICLSRGEYDLPGVKVLSLGKPAQGWSSGREKILGKIRAFVSFYRYLWQERKNYDTVFVHMNPIYIGLAGFWWKMSRRPIYLWYTHRQVDLKLRIAEKFVVKIFTAAKESLCLVSKKKIIVGHGIDLENFDCISGKSSSNRLTILHVGRLTKIKNCQTLLAAAKLLKGEGLDFVVKFIGGPSTSEDQEYFLSLKDFVRKEGLAENIEFVGSVPNHLMSDYYCQSGLTINLAPTGGIDKAVLESMASGVPALIFNKAFVKYLGRWSKTLLLENLDEVELSRKILSLKNEDRRKEIGDSIRETIKSEIGLDFLIQKLVDEME